MNDADSCIDDNCESSDDLFDSDEEYFAVTDTRRVEQINIPGNKITNLNDLEKDIFLHPLSAEFKSKLFKKHQGNN